MALEQHSATFSSFSKLIECFSKVSSCSLVYRGEQAKNFLKTRHREFANSPAHSGIAKQISLMCQSANRKSLNFYD